MRILNVALALVLLLAGPAWAECTPKVPPGSLVQPGKLQLAINPTLPPQQYVDEKGELQGLNVELGRELGKRLCIPVEFVRMDFPAMVPMWFFPIAIATGNAVVLKPSEKDPSAALWLAALWKEAGLPDGIFNVLFGPDLTGFVRHGNTRGLFEGRDVVSVLTGEPEYLLPLGDETPEGWLVTGYPVGQVPSARAFEAAYDAFVRQLDAIEASIPRRIDPESEAADRYYEALALDPRFAELFTDPERRTARSRLEDFGWGGTA